MPRQKTHLQVAPESSNFLLDTSHDPPGILLEDSGGGVLTALALLRPERLGPALRKHYVEVLVGPEVDSSIVGNSGELERVLAREVARLSTQDGAIKALTQVAVATLNALPDELGRNHFAQKSAGRKMMISGIVTAADSIPRTIFSS